ncbi:MAG: acetoacetate--CoA ligase [Planctomycetes bacterium]|nr:acetoacetate--CoA ligase [Planctomycetota bacterium]
MSEPIWSPPPERVARAQLTRFAAQARATCGAPASTGDLRQDAEAFHRWSVTHMDEFWRLLVDFAGVRHSGSLAPARIGAGVEGTRFFPELRLSYAENLLLGQDTLPALIEVREDGTTRELTRGALRARVRAVAAGLRAAGLGAGDHVAAIAANRIESVVACLATASLGATWSSCAPDMGERAVLERFQPLHPKVLFCHSGYAYQGAAEDVRGRVAAVIRALPGLRLAVALDAADPGPSASPAWTDLDRLAAHGEDGVDFARLPFAHPLFVLFSSGTTGRPKGIVHGAGGTLLTHLKEHLLHGDLHEGDRICFLTSCGWMMWNWLISALAVHATVVLYDGSPTFPTPRAPFEHAARLGVTHLGLSPAFLNVCRTLRISVRDKLDLPRLRTVYSTGSILPDSLFHWIHEKVRRDVQIASISGGTDLLGCFLQGHPWLPVHAGELQARSLGMDVRALHPDANGVGELVCAAPFPSRPVGFVDDPDGRRYHQAYYAQNPGCWTHGDLLEETPTGARIHGRSDGVMNIHGVRIGPAELYSALESVQDVADALAIEYRPKETSELILFVVLRAGRTLDQDLVDRIRTTLKETCSRAHVPARILQVGELPYTHSGKKSERAANDMAHGRAVTNRAALRNPDSLDQLVSALRGGA